MIYSIDVNECVQELNQCSHMCNNTIGSYACGCPPGSALSVDRRVCTVLSVEVPSSSMHTSASPATKMFTTVLPTSTVPTTILCTSTLLTPMPTSTVPSIPCGANLTEESGEIIVDDVVSSDCVWTVKLQDESKFLHMILEQVDFVPYYKNCSSCYLEVFNGGNTKSTLLGKYCKAGTEIETALNEVTIRYPYDGCTGSFKISYTSDSEKRSR